MKCRICGSEHLSQFTAAERMNNLLEEFIYDKCQNCFSLQIDLIPENIEKYYQGNYYSLKPFKAGLVEKIRFMWFKHSHGKKNIIGFIIKLIKGKPLLLKWLRLVSIKKDAPILDIGCGNGYMLNVLNSLGYTNLTGIDPNIQKDISYANGIKIYNTDIDEFVSQERSFSLIMLHHVIEHLPNPEATIEKLNSLLATNGRIIIRTPLANSYAAAKYSAYWVQLDAPRHLHILSKDGMSIIANRTGFTVEKIKCDSTSFQFWGSEQYMKGMALNDKRSIAINWFVKLLHFPQIFVWSKKAETLNKHLNGDQVIYCLRRKPQELS